MKENVESLSDPFNEIFTSSDKSVNRKIFCGKLEQFAKSELELKYSEAGAAYLIEYRWQHRRRARKLKIGFQLAFRWGFIFSQAIMIMSFQNV